MLYHRALELQLVLFLAASFHLCCSSWLKADLVKNPHPGGDAQRFDSFWGEETVPAVWPAGRDLLSKELWPPSCAQGFRWLSLYPRLWSSELWLHRWLLWGLAVLALASPFHLPCLRVVNLDYPQLLWQHMLVPIMCCGPGLAAALEPKAGPPCSSVKGCGSTHTAICKIRSFSFYLCPSFLSAQEFVFPLDAVPLCSITEFYCCRL